ncbi:sperm acrosome developmental regulator [Ochotona princeps]|uniref:sperm acrosome developmental regulator n=1 Tax=Ochotona princeps TaxID=9978 RepID=UPI002714C96D|nr:sperm acrosome developmental regulator [Ochotona princeps]
MAVVMRFFKWVRRVWCKISCWILSWRHRTKPAILDTSASKKQALKKTETPKVFETFKLVESTKEAKTPRTDECPKVAGSLVSARVPDRPQTEPGRPSRSLLRLPRTAMRSMSTLMLSALQTGWQMCSWKSSLSSASGVRQMKSPWESPEAEMLREVYLVLWAIRRQLRQLARRQERRRHHARPLSPQPDQAQVLKEDARSPL